MTFTVYDASVPIFAHALTNMQAWIAKAVAEGSDETALLEARLAPDMRPLPAQFQMASDTAKNTVARLTGIEAPSMPDTESTLAELQDRCRRTIEFVQSVAPASFEGADTREVLMKFPNGMGYRFAGSAYLTGFALPNFFFHATTAYALMRAQGVSLGKPDFLQHLGQPEKMTA
jgi:hypothetical protein